MITKENKNIKVALTGESIKFMENNFDKFQEKILRAASKSKPKKSTINWLAESELLTRIVHLHKELGIDYKIIAEVCTNEGIEIDGRTHVFPITVQQIYAANMVRKKANEEKQKAEKRKKVEQKKAVTKKEPAVNAQAQTAVSPQVQSVGNAQAQPRTASVAHEEARRQPSVNR